ncbi:MAG: hypothetical protein IT539_12950 [Bradyrhizobiaceae bacterium]|nr:hypothetical protein [Bradyrhizobiaceae bacterium]
MTDTAADQLKFRRTLLLAALIAAVANFIAFYPGLLHHDAWAYFDASRTGKWTNWQPPLLGFLWYPLRAIHDGPQPMFVLFVAAYWAGFVLIADALRHEGRLLASLTFLAAFYPMALNYNGQLVKDISMATSLLIGAGIAAGVVSGTIRWRTLALPLMGLFLVMGAFMRANSLFGLPPLIDLAGRAISKRWAGVSIFKRAIIVCVISAAVAPAHILADRNLFRVEDIKPMSQLQVFDIGGITYFSGSDGFQGFFGPDFVARNATCYTPRHWDVYGWMVGERGCPEVYEKMKPNFGWPLSKLWLEAIASHPFAYLSHRFAHANRFFQFLCTDCKEPVFTGWQSGNQKEFTFEPTWLFHMIDAGAQALNNSPLGPPYVWLLICLAWAWAGLGIWNESTRTIIVSLTLSGAMYALGYFIIGIAHEYRYIYWTLLCALIATPAIVLRVLVRSDAPTVYRLYPVLMIVAVIAFRELMIRFML